MTAYTETILKYAGDDSRAGTLEQPDGLGEVGLGAAEAGQKLAVRFALQVAGPHIRRVRYQVFGCGFTMAACAAAAQLAEGAELAQVARLDPQTLDRTLGGLPAERSYCAELAVEALQAAVASVQQQAGAVTRNLNPAADHGPRLLPSDPVYRALIESAAPKGIPAEDRRLFACLLAVADQEPVPLYQALGLSPLLLETLLLRAFPEIEPRAVFAAPTGRTSAPPEINPAVQALLLGFLRKDTCGWPQFASLLLARIIAARAAHPGHLWVAMGLFERPALSAAIGRHLPGLLAANDRKMRWKRFLFRQVCELSGGMRCKSPVCGACSDYALCFAPEEE